MKKLFFILAAFSACLIFSCKNDDATALCEAVNCLNGGACNDGTCVCPTGFSGEFCEISISGPCDTLVCLNGGYCDQGWCYGCDNCFEGQFCQTNSRDKFINAYNGFLNTSFIDIAYNITIAEHADNLCRAIITDNYENSYFGLGESNSNNLTVPQQSFVFDDVAGTISGNFNIDSQNGQQLFGTLYFTDAQTGYNFSYSYEGLSE